MTIRLQGEYGTNARRNYVTEMTTSMFAGSFA
jgi:hypothetical protein